MMTIHQLGRATSHSGAARQVRGTTVQFISRKVQNVGCRRYKCLFSKMKRDSRRNTRIFSLALLEIKLAFPRSKGIYYPTRHLKDISLHRDKYKRLATDRLFHFPFQKMHLL